jgi:adenosylcobyric acid synthase
LSKFIVVLGTSSHSGKSIIVTGLCRILSNLGLRVAPFKSQNMSLNSWVTFSGAEIGIAQAVQAWAARAEPSEFMNPILLKPKGDRTSQVIVLGRPMADKSAEEYYKDIEGLKGVVDASLRELEKEYDYIVVEGAGGAAEINLFDRDLANIFVARHLQAPILLVGDIERGGVFASLYGTMQLLPEDIRPLVKGLVINKFRGDPAILTPGLEDLERMTGVPVLGVLPYLSISIPSEDSVSLQDKRGDRSMAMEKMPGMREAGQVEIAVIRLPRISNFTDFEPLEGYARVRYVELGEELGEPDAVIIPGTKNTVSDLNEMKEKGMDRQILALRDTLQDRPILGICGGYQMLGREIVDSGVEDTAGTIPGLGLLDAVTRFDLYEKRTVQVRKLVTGSGPILEKIRGQELSGYEIHMGVTEAGCEKAFEDDGAVAGGGLVIGTYLHGIFENENFRNAFLDYLYGRKNLVLEKGARESVASENSETENVSLKGATREKDAFDDLAGAMYAHLDMVKVLKMLDLS